MLLLGRNKVEGGIQPSGLCLPPVLYGHLFLFSIITVNVQTVTSTCSVASTLLDMVVC